MTELDIHLSRDGEVVVIHDQTLKRTTSGKGSVSDFSIKELKALDAGSWFGPQFSGEKIPTLGEVLDLARGKILVNIEIKEVASGPNSISNLADRSLQEVKRGGMLNQVLYSSFNSLALARIRKDPSARTALLFHQPWNTLQEISDIPFAVLNLNKSYLNLEKIAGIHRGGMKVNTYTVDSEEDMERFIRWGVDGIITNHPDRLIRILE